MQYMGGKQRIAKHLVAFITRERERDSMQYMGGKQRIAKPLTEQIIKYGDGTFYDLFCGSCNVTSLVTKHFEMVVANDLNPYLIAMWKALQQGWNPPSDVSEETYQYVKSNPDEDIALSSFVLFGCSFSGKWMGGYARGGEGRNYAANAYNTTMKKLSNLRDVEFMNISYRDVPIKEGSVVYCDIPYRNTTQYNAVESFDHEVFYEWAKSTANHSTILVSEYLQNVPTDATVVWEHRSKKDMRNKSGEQEQTIECLFTYK